MSDWPADDREVVAHRPEGLAPPNRRANWWKLVRVAVFESGPARSSTGEGLPVLIAGVVVTDLSGVDHEGQPRRGGQMSASDGLTDGGV